MLEYKKISGISELLINSTTNKLVVRQEKVKAFLTKKGFKDEDITWINNYNGTRYTDLLNCIKIINANEGDSDEFIYDFCVKGHYVINDVKIDSIRWIMQKHEKHLVELIINNAEALTLMKDAKEYDNTLNEHCLLMLRKYGKVLPEVIIKEDVTQIFKETIKENVTSANTEPVKLLEFNEVLENSNDEETDIIDKIVSKFGEVFSVIDVPTSISDNILLCIEEIICNLSHKNNIKDLSKKDIIIKALSEILKNLDYKNIRTEAINAGELPNTVSEEKLKNIISTVLENVIQHMFGKEINVVDKSTTVEPKNLNNKPIKVIDVIPTPVPKVEPVIEKAINKEEPIVEEEKVIVKEEEPVIDDEEDYRDYSKCDYLISRELKVSDIEDIKSLRIFTDINKYSCDPSEYSRFKSSEFAKVRNAIRNSYYKFNKNTERVYQAIDIVIGEMDHYSYIMDHNAIRALIKIAVA